MFATTNPISMVASTFDVYSHATDPVTAFDYTFNRKATRKMAAAKPVAKNDDKEACPEHKKSKRRLLNKLLRLLVHKESSNKVRAEEKRKQYQRRQRSSQSSAFSGFEPMPTIYEESEEYDFSCADADDYQDARSLYSYN